MNEREISVNRAIRLLLDAAVGIGISREGRDNLAVLASCVEVQQDFAIPPYNFGPRGTSLEESKDRFLAWLLSIAASDKFSGLSTTPATSGSASVRGAAHQ